MLSKYIEKLGEGTKIIFIDELPWLNTPEKDDLFFFSEKYEKCHFL